MIKLHKYEHEYFVPHISLVFEQEVVCTKSFYLVFITIGYYLARKTLCTYTDARVDTYIIDTI